MAPQNSTLKAFSTHEVITKRSGMFYFSIALGVLMLGGMSAGLLVIAAREKNILVGLGALLVAWVALYLVRAYYRCVPVVRVGISGITFNDDFHAWSDVQRIQLTGNQPLDIFGARDMEGASLEFSDGTVKALHDGMYRNLSEVRNLIQQFVPEKIVAELTEKSPEEHVDTGDTFIVESPVEPVAMHGAQYIVGRPYRSFRAIVIYALLLALVTWLLILAIDGEWAMFFFSAAGFLGLYWLLTFSVNYFGLSGTHFFLRNSFIPWKRRTIALADIEEIVLASNHQGSNVLRVIDKNFKVRNFFASSLRGKDWLALMRLMRNQGIRVKDENDFALWEQPKMKTWRRWMILSILFWVALCLVSGVWVQSVQYSQYALIWLKIGWLVFIALSFVLTLRFIMKLGAGRSD